MLSIEERRKIGGCFYPQIILDRSWDDVYEQLEIANRVEAAVKQMLDGEVSAEDMLEIVEDCFDIDDYIEEVEANLEEVSQSIIWLQ